MIQKKRHVITISDFTKEDFEQIFQRADYLQKENVKTLTGKIIATLFFEPSTRTRLSFESAAQRLGATTLGFSDIHATSVVKGESLAHTIKMVNGYADAIVMRHPRDGAAKYASTISKIPIINGGDGANQHPSQTMLDLYAIRSHFGKIDGIKIAMIGDLKYSRVLHSLTTALRLYDAQITFIAPEELKMPQKYTRENDTQTTDLNAALNCDVIYSTRIQKERFTDLNEYNRLKDTYLITENFTNQLQPNAIILHALPIVNEIDTKVDKNPKAKYFKQANDGVYVRMALLDAILG